MTEDDRRHDYASRDRLEQIHEGYVRFSRRVGFALVVIVVVLCGSLAAEAFLIAENRENADEAQQVARDIEAGVERSLRVTCESINMRHDRAISELNKQIDKLRPSLTDEEIERVERSRDANVALIDALVPKRDCPEYVRQQLGRAA